jgi:aryl-alcohol dehydrogenase-like predicted oxidoreductase
MKQRPFGRSGVTVSEVGLGTWQLGGTEWGDLPEDDALAILHAAAATGVTLFDTADIYGGGRSETLIGRYLRETGAPIRIATKLGRRQDAPNGWPQNFTRDSIFRHTEESLKRLGVPRVFLQQFHCIPTDELRKGHVFDHARALQTAGLVDHWGVSVETVEEGLLCLDQPGCAALQVIFNVFRQKPLDELLPKAKAKGVAILARVPLASGLLTGKFRPGQRFGEKDHRHFNADGQAFHVGETFAGVPLARGLELVEKVKALLAPDESRTLGELALRWVLDCDAVTSVIPGATRAEQVRSNARASGLPPLTADQHRRLADLYRAEVAPAVRGAY